MGIEEVEVEEERLMDGMKSDGKSRRLRDDFMGRRRWA